MAAQYARKTNRLPSGAWYAPKPAAKPAPVQQPAREPHHPYERPAAQPVCRRPAAAPARTVKLLGKTESGVLTLEVRQNGTVDTYVAAPLQNDLCIAYRIIKVETNGERVQADGYDVNICDQEGFASCECLGWLRHSKCRHISLLRALTLAGKI